MRARRTLLAGPLAALAWSAGCVGSPVDEALPSSADVPLVVRRGELVRRVLLAGELKAVRAVDIVVPRTPQWNIQIRWMEADGAVVTAGQKVVEFDNSAVASTLETNRLAARRAADELERLDAQTAAQLAEKEFTLASKRVELEKARIDADVPEALLAARDWQERQLTRRRAEVACAKAEDEVASTRRGRDADLAVARIALAKARREVTVAEQAIAALTVTAPRDGILQIADHPWEGRKLQVDDNVWVGLPVMRIPDLGAMRVEAVLFDVDDGLVTAGAPARCLVDTYPDEAFTGAVISVTPMAQELRRGSPRRAFRVTIALAASDPERLRPGMSVRAEVTAARLDQVLLAPRAGLRLDESGSRAVLESGGLAPVRLGPCSAQDCVVEDGLAEGTRLGRSSGGAA